MTRLDKPKGYTKEFDWNVYFHEMKKQPVPFSMFSEVKMLFWYYFTGNNQNNVFFRNKKMECDRFILKTQIINIVT